jgi:Amt family ammonium transporter
MAHMVWGVGGLLNATGGHIPSLDFAGGTVVHVTSGVSAWSPASTWASASATRTPTCRRTPWCSASSAPACCGWAGSASTPAAPSAASPLATSAFVNTHFAAAAAAIGWSIAEWIHNGKPTALGAISGAVAGLVAITPASGFVQPLSALAIGLIAGFFCSFMVFKVKSIFGYDDSLDAFGVHGAGGTSARC